MNIQIPGLSIALEDLKALPEKTEEILGHLSRIESLLEELLDVQKSQVNPTVYTRDDLT